MEFSSAKNLGSHEAFRFALLYQALVNRGSCRYKSRDQLAIHSIGRERSKDLHASMFGVESKKKKQGD